MAILRALLLLAVLEACLRFLVPLPSVIPPPTQTIWRPLGHGLAQMSIGRRQVLRLQKSPSTFRIFVVGSSETYGEPLTMFGSIPFQFQRRLSSRQDGRAYEVICAAKAGSDSLEHREYVRQIVDSLSPDCVIILSGNCEFGRLRWQKAAAHWLALYAWMRYAWGYSLLDPNQYQRATVTAAECAAVRERYRDHLADMADSCRQHNVPLIFCTVPDNETWCLPGEEHRQPYVDGLRELREGAFGPAKSLLDAAMETDPRPLRALPSFADITRQVAARYSAPVCPLIADLEARSERRILDDRWFFDECHLKWVTTTLIAGFLEKTLTRAGLADRAHHGQVPPAPRQAWRLDTWPGAVETLQLSISLSPRARRILQGCVTGYFNSHKEEDVWAYLHQAPSPDGDADALVMEAHVLFTNGMFDAAADYYQRALQVARHDAALLLDVGYAKWYAGQYREACRAFSDSGIMDEEVRRCLSLANDI